MIQQQTVHQSLQIDRAGIQGRPMTLRHVEIEHVLDQLLQLDGVARQDVEDLPLRRVERPGDIVGQQLRAFPDGTQRRLELMGDLSQELGFLFFQIDESLPQPVEPLPHHGDVARAAQPDRPREQAVPNPSIA